MNFRENFSRLFDESGLSQEEFGLKIGATKNQVYNWRNGTGEPKTDMLVRIADEFNVTTDWLLGRTPTRNTNSTLSKGVLEDIKQFQSMMEKKYGIKWE